jgi:hypothetical protein
MFQDAPGSIHNDAVASKLGFKGGTVPGTVHMDQFVPLLLDIFGEEWFETGGLSLYFLKATVDLEEVRATAQVDGSRARLQMHNRSGDLICEGTGNIGGTDPRSEMTERMDAQGAATSGSLRILADVKVGDTQRDMPVCLPHEQLLQGLASVSERLPIYDKKGVLPPSHIVRLAYISRAQVMERQKLPAVGLFGALQVQQDRGALLAGVGYLAHSRILKLTESPRTENVWYDVFFDDPSGVQAGSMRFCLRYLKASSPLWAG